MPQPNVCANAGHLLLPPAPSLLPPAPVNPPPPLPPRPGLLIYIGPVLLDLEMTPSWPCGCERVPLPLATGSISALHGSRGLPQFTSCVIPHGPVNWQSQCGADLGGRPDPTPDEVWPPDSAARSHALGPRASPSPQPGCPAPMGGCAHPTSEPSCLCHTGLGVVGGAWRTGCHFH